MADKNDGGDKTEKPTPKRLKDAREKGDVPKSKDLTSVVGLFVTLLLALFATGYIGERFAALFDAAFLSAASASAGQPFPQTAAALGWAALLLFVGVTALLLLPMAVVGTIAEFLQAGAVLTFEKIKPGLDKLNPVEGIKKMFSMDNLVELVKTILKAALILGVTWLVVRGSLAELIGRTGPQPLPLEPGAGAGAAAQALNENARLGVRLLAWTLGVFLFVALLDMGWQRHSYMKKLRMSLRDIRDEHKQNEGDPHVKSNRKQLHQEWANQNAVQSARQANVLVVNPTHIAVALDYDADATPVPIVAAMGEGPLAQAMREAAEEAGVPIIRNVAVARALFERAAVDDFVPRDMFDAIAEIILWAKRAREEAEAARRARLERPAR